MRPLIIVKPLLICLALLAAQPAFAGEGKELAELAYRNFSSVATLFAIPVLLLIALCFIHVLKPSKILRVIAVIIGLLILCIYSFGFYSFRHFIDFGIMGHVYVAALWIFILCMLMCASFLVFPYLKKKESLPETVQQETPAKHRNLDVLIVIMLAYTLLVNAIDTAIRLHNERWFLTPSKYFSLCAHIITAFLPFLIAFAVRNKKLKLAALVIGAIITVSYLYSSFDWLHKELIRDSDLNDI